MNSMISRGSVHGETRDRQFNSVDLVRDGSSLVPTIHQLLQIHTVDTHSDFSFRTGLCYISDSSDNPEKTPTLTGLSISFGYLLVYYKPRLGISVTFFLNLNTISII
jgi:cyanate permease